MQQMPGILRKYRNTESWPSFQAVYGLCRSETFDTIYYLLRTGTNSARTLLRSFLCYVFTYLLSFLKTPPFLLFAHLCLSTLQTKLHCISTFFSSNQTIFSHSTAEQTHNGFRCSKYH